jgi:hypothetical protein
MRRAGFIWFIAIGLIAAGCGSVAASVLPGHAATTRSGTAAPRVRVQPAVGTRHSQFRVDFRPGAKPASMKVSSRYEVRVTGPDRSGCEGSAIVALRALSHSTLQRAQLAPAGGSGGWCRGTYHGRVERLIVPVCRPPAMACPMFIAVAGTVARFSFRVE